MKKLRLLISKDCNRSCEGCCDKGRDLDALPVCKDFRGYDEIILTGGEPMLKMELVKRTILKIRKESNAKIYMYTAAVEQYENFTDLLDLLDGITLTLHEQKDADNFKKLDYIYICGRFWVYKLKSLRLNVFEGINFKASINWIIKDNIKWIKNCPLPSDEVFMKLGE